MTSVLIVDDSPVIRRLLRAALTDTGWIICDEAASGYEGIVKAQELHPDLIILDLSMPEMNGLEAARALNKLMPTTPLLLFTMHVASHVEKEARAVGIRKVISKLDGTAAIIGEVRSLLFV